MHHLSLLRERTGQPDGSRESSGEEPEQQHRVDGDHGGHQQIGGGPVDEMKHAKQGRQAEADHPGIEAHTDAAKRLGVDASDQPRADRHADEQARQDQRDQPDALAGVTALRSQ